jgi:hypothetical protein
MAHETVPLWRGKIESFLVRRIPDQMTHSFFRRDFWDHRQRREAAPAKTRLYSRSDDGGEPGPRDDDLVRRPTVLVTRPISAAFLVSAVALLLAIALPALRAKREEAMQQ